MSRCIAFRVDTSLAIGTGHVARCLNLANALAERGNQCVFVCAEYVGHRGAMIVAEGHEVILLPRDGVHANDIYAQWLGTTQAVDAAQTIAALQAFKPDWVVTDHYGIDAQWHDAVRAALGCRILAIDDMANRVHGCNALLDQNFHANAASLYLEKIPANCRTFFGPLYALLKPEFFAPTVRARDHMNPKNALVFFGGVDATGETLKTLSALAHVMHSFARVDVVCGSGNPYLDEIKTLCADSPYQLHVDTPHMAQLIAAADIGIGGGGVNTWERCFLHLPTLVVTVAENQEGIARDTAAAGLMVVAGKSQEMNSAALATAITHFVADGAGRAAIAARCAEYFTGSGMEAVMEMLDA